MELKFVIIRTRAIDHRATGAAVRQNRKKRGVTLEHVSKASGLSVAYLSALERGCRKWSQALLDQVTEAIRSM